MDAQPMNDQVISASDEEPKFLSSENEEISSNENQDAISKAIRQVEEQLNIQTSENTEETTLDPISRILRIGSTQKALRDQVSNLITDINKRGINNYQFIKDTLGNILEKVEGQASPPTGNLDKQEKLQNLRKLADEKNPQSHELRQALQKSLEINHESESTIEFLQNRVIDLERQINFYLESQQNLGLDAGYDVGDESELGSVYSPRPSDFGNSTRFSTSRPTRPTSQKVSTSRSTIGSIVPVPGEEIEPLALRDSLRKQIASEYETEIEELKSQLKLKAAEAEQNLKETDSMNDQYNKLKKEYDMLLEKFKKLKKQYQVDTTKLKARITDLEAQLKAAKEKIGKLNKSASSAEDQRTQQLTAEIEKLKSENAQTNDKLNKATESLAKAKKSYTTLKEKYDKSQKDLQTSKSQERDLQLEQETAKKHQELMARQELIEKQMIEHQKMYDDQIHTLEQTVEEKDINIDKLNQEIERLKGEISELESKVVTSTDVDITIDNVAQKELEELHEKVSNLEQSEADLKKQNENQRNYLTQIRKALGLPENPVPDTNEMQSDLESIDPEQFYSKEVIEQVEKLNQEMNDKESQLEKVRQALQLSNQDDDNIVDTIKTYKDDNEKLKQHVKQLREALGLSSNEEDAHEEPHLQQIQDAKEKRELAISELKEIAKLLGVDSNKEPSDMCNEIKSVINTQNEQKEKAISELKELADLLGVDSTKDTSEMCNEIKSTINTQNEQKEKTETQLKEIAKLLGVDSSQNTSDMCDEIKTAISTQNEQKEKTETELKQIAGLLGVDSSKDTNEMCNEMKSTINKQNEHNEKTETQLKELASLLGVDSSKNTSEICNELKSTINTQSQHNEKAEQQLKEIAKLLGVDSNKDPSDMCNEMKSVINTQNEQKEKAISELKELATLLGVDTNKEPTEIYEELSSAIQTQNENNEKVQKQLKEIAGLLGIDSSKDTNEMCNEMKSTINKQNEQKEKTETQLKEIAQLLGVDSSKDTNEMCNEMKSSITTHHEQTSELNRIKETIGNDDNAHASIEKQKEENEQLRKHLQDVLTTLGLPPFEEKEDGTIVVPNKEQLTQQCNQVNQQIETMKTENEKLKKELTELKKALNIPEDGDFNENQSNQTSLTDVITKQKEENEQLRKHLQEVMTTLGLPPFEEKEDGTIVVPNKEQLARQCNQVNQQIETMKTENEKLKKELTELKKALNIPEDGDFNENQSNQTSLTDVITKQKEENEQLRKHLQEVLTTLGLPPFEEKEDGTIVVPNKEQLTEQCKQVNQQIETMKTENEKLKKELTELKKALNIPEDGESTENQSITETVKSQQEQNSVLIENIQTILQTLGLQPLDANPTSKSIEENCKQIKEHIEQLKNEKERTESDLMVLRETLEIEGHENTTGTPHQKIAELVQNQKLYSQSINRICEELQIDNSNQSVEQACSSIEEQIKLLTSQSQQFKELLELTGLSNENSGDDVSQLIKKHNDNVCQILGIETANKPLNQLQTEIIESIEKEKKENTTLKQQLKEILKKMGVHDDIDTNSSEAIHQAIQKVEQDQIQKEKVGDQEYAQQENEELKQKMNELRKQLGLKDNDDFNQILNECDQLKKQNDDMSSSLKEITKSLNLPEDTSLSDLQSKAQEMRETNEQQNQQISKIRDQFNLKSDDDLNNLINTQSRSIDLIDNDILQELAKAMNIDLNEELDENQRQEATKQLIQSIQNQFNLFNDLHKLLETNELKSELNLNEDEQMTNEQIINHIQKLQKRSVNPQLKGDEMNDLYSILSNELNTDQTNVAETVKQLIDHKKELESELSQANEKVDGLQKQYDEMNKELIETRSKASGIIEERGALSSNIQQQFNELLQAIQSPDGNQSVHQKLHDISDMIGELRNNNVKSQQFEDDRQKIIEKLTENGYLQNLSPEERENVNLVELFEQCVNELNQYKKASQIKERSIDLIDQTNNEEEHLTSKVRINKDDETRLREMLNLNEENDLIGAVESIKDQNELFIRKTIQVASIIGLDKPEKPLPTADSQQPENTEIKPENQDNFVESQQIENQETIEQQENQDNSVEHNENQDNSVEHNENQDNSVEQQENQENEEQHIEFNGNLQIERTNVNEEFLDKLVDNITLLVETKDENILLRSQMAAIQRILGIEVEEGSNASDQINQLSNRITELSQEKAQLDALKQTFSQNGDTDLENPTDLLQKVSTTKKENEDMKEKLNELRQMLGLPVDSNEDDIQQQFNEVFKELRKKRGSDQISSQNDIVEEICNLYEGSNSDIIEQIKANKECVEQLRKAYQNLQPYDSVDSMSDEEILQKMVNLIKSNNQNGGQSQRLQHELSAALRQFIQPQAFASSEFYDSEASFSEDECKATSNQIDHKNQDDMTTDEIIESVVNLIEQSRQLQEQNNEMKSQMDVSKLSSISNTAYTQERNVITQMLLDNEDEDFDSEFDSDATEETKIVSAIKKLKSRYDRVKSELDEANSEKQKLQQETEAIPGLKDRISQLERENKEREQTINTIIDDRQNLTNQLMKQIQDTIQNSSELSTPIVDQLQELTSELTKQQEMFQNHYNGLENAKIQQLETENKELQKQFEDLQNELETELADLIEDSNEPHKINKIKSGVQKLKQINQTLKEENGQLQSENDQLTEQNNQLIEQNEQLIEHGDQLKSDMKNENDIMTIQKISILQEADSITIERDQLLEEMDLINEVLGSYNSKKTKKITKYRTVETEEEEEEEYEEEYEEEIPIHTRVSLLKEENNRLQNELISIVKAATKEIDNSPPIELHEQLDELGNQIAQQNENMAIAIKEEVSNDNITPIQSPRRSRASSPVPKSPRSQLNEVTNQLKIQIDQLTKENVELSSQLDELKSEKECIYNELNLNEDEVPSVFDFIQELKGNLNEKENEINELKSNLENSSRFIDQFKQNEREIIDALGDSFETVGEPNEEGMNDQFETIIEKKHHENNENELQQNNENENEIQQEIDNENEQNEAQQEIENEQSGEIQQDNEIEVKSNVDEQINDQQEIESIEVNNESQNNEQEINQNEVQSNADEQQDNEVEVIQTEEEEIQQEQQDNEVENEVHHEEDQQEENVQEVEVLEVNQNEDQQENDNEANEQNEIQQDNETEDEPSEPQHNEVEPEQQDNENEVIVNQDNQEENQTSLNDDEQNEAQQDTEQQQVDNQQENENEQQVDNQQENENEHQEVDSQHEQENEQQVDNQQENEVIESVEVDNENNLESDHNSQPTQETENSQHSTNDENQLTTQNDVQLTAEQQNEAIIHDQIIESIKKLRDQLKNYKEELLHTNELQQEHQLQTNELNDEIQTLKSRILELEQERQEIFQAMNSNDDDQLSDVHDAAHLIDHLNSLKNRIGQQQNNLSTVFEEESPTNSSTPTLSPRNSRIKPRAQRQIFNETIATLQEQLKEALLDNIAKDNRIGELEQEIEEIQSILPTEIKSRDLDNSLLESISMMTNKVAEQEELLAKQRLQCDEQDELNRTTSQLVEEQDRINKANSQLITEQESELKEKTEKIVQLENDLTKLNEENANYQKEVTQLTLYLQGIQDSVRRAQNLLGVTESQPSSPKKALYSNNAIELESQILNFITKNLEEHNNKAQEYEDQIKDLNDRISLLNEECQGLKTEKSSVLSILGFNDVDASDELQSPVYQKVQDLSMKIAEQSAQIGVLKDRLKTAVNTIQQLSNERTSILQALAPNSPTNDQSVEKTTLKLIKKLESLGIEIDQQNDELTAFLLEENSSSDNSSIEIPSKSKETRSLNSILDAFSIIRQKLNEKDQIITELENEIDNLKKGESQNY